MQPYVCGVFRRLQKSQEAIQQHVGGLLTGCSNLSHYQISVFPGLRLNNTTAQAEELINDDKNVHHMNVLLVGWVAFMTTIRPDGFTTFFIAKIILNNISDGSALQQTLTPPLFPIFPVSVRGEALQASTDLQQGSI